MNRTGDGVRWKIKVNRVRAVTVEERRCCNGAWFAVGMNLDRLFDRIAIVRVGGGDPKRTCIYGKAACSPTSTDVDPFDATVACMSAGVESVNQSAGFTVTGSVMTCVV